MGRDKKNEHNNEQFTKWILAHRMLPAWKALSFPARDAYFHLQIRCFADTADRKRTVPNNNGEIYRSPRKLANDMGCNVKTAMSALAELQAKGWIVCTKMWERGYDGNGRTALFRLTMMSTTKNAATREPYSWVEGKDYPVQAYSAHALKGRKKQNPPPQKGPLAHRQMGHYGEIRLSSAPLDGTESAENSQSSDPSNGSYLIAIPTDELDRSFYDGGRGLCGKATRQGVAA